MFLLDEQIFSIFLPLSLLLTIYMSRLERKIILLIGCLIIYMIIAILAGEPFSLHLMSFNIIPWLTFFALLKKFKKPYALGTMLLIYSLGYWLQSNMDLPLENTLEIQHSFYSLTKFFALTGIGSIVIGFLSDKHILSKSFD